MSSTKNRSPPFNFNDLSKELWYEARELAEEFQSRCDHLSALRNNFKLMKEYPLELVITQPLFKPSHSEKIAIFGNHINNSCASSEPPNFNIENPSSRSIGRKNNVDLPATIGQSKNQFLDQRAKTIIELQLQLDDIQTRLDNINSIIINNLPAINHNDDNYDIKGSTIWSVLKLIHGKFDNRLLFFVVWPLVIYKLIHIYHHK